MNSSQDKEVIPENIDKNKDMPRSAILILAFALAAFSIIAKPAELPPETTKEPNVDLSIVDKEATDQIVKGFQIFLYLSAILAAAIFLYSKNHLPGISDPAGIIFVVAYIISFVASILLTIYAGCLFSSAARRITTSHLKANNRVATRRQLRFATGFGFLLFQAPFIVALTAFIIKTLQG